MGPSGWRLNSILLENTEVRNIIEAEIRSFFQVHEGSANGITVWDCFKSYVRGILISQMIYRRKKNQKDQKELLQCFDLLEKSTFFSV